MKVFHLSVADGIRQNAKNKTYSTHAEISSIEELTKAVQFDHTAGYFKNDERSVPNFIEADCLIMDCDNDHTEDPGKWLTPERLSERLPGVECVIVGSKNNYKDTGKYSARPRYHVYFPISETITQAGQIRSMKEALLAIVPEFDGGAKDAARFIYGVENPQAEHREGSLLVDEFLTINLSDDFATLNEPDERAYAPSEEAEQTPAYDIHEQATQDAQAIPEGQRNNTLFTTALNALTKYKEKKAREVYDKAVSLCQPPLPAPEAIKIWEQALKYARAIEDRVRERQKKILTLRVIEQALRDMNIAVRFNVITRDIEASELPQDNEHVPEAYYALDEYMRKKSSAEILPAFLTSYFKSNNYGVADKFITDAIAILANAQPFNPVLDMLNSTTWDGYDRIADLYPVLGIINDNHRSFLRKWLHQAVALALNDTGDINADFVLVLQGRQGIGKTNFFRALAMRPEWFAEGTVIDLGNKDTVIQATSTWICELGELDSTLRKDQSALKAFITAKFDTYRIPYARKATKTERRTCFCATVNPAETIRDDTGSRRYVFIPVDSIDKAFIYGTMTPQWCAQLWKQVYTMLYLPNRKGFYLTDNERAFIEAENEKFTVMLEGESEILDCLDWNCDSWGWTTIRELEFRCSYLKDKRIDARKIGRAATKIVSRIATREGKPIEEYRHCAHGLTEYWLPTKTK